MSHRLTLAVAAATILASTALYSLFAAQSWFWAGAGGVVVVAGVGTLTRRGRLPAVACLAAELAGLLLYLNLLFAASRSWLLVVPNTSSLGYLRELAAQGSADADRFSPPVPVTPGLLLLAAMGIGLAAIAADMLAVRLRHSALAGAPLLALFIVPATTPVSRGAVGTTIVFALGTAGYLLILWADGRERIRVWGRTVGLWRPSPVGPAGAPRTVAREVPREPDAHSLASAGRRVGLASMVVALCIPLVVPGLRVYRLFPAHVNLFGSAAGSLGTAGGAAVPNPLAAMNSELHDSQPVTVLTYRTTDLSPQYFQLYALNDLTSAGWTLDTRLGPMATTSRSLPPAPGLTGDSGYAVTTRVSFSRAVTGGAFGLTFLPVPYPPTRVIAPGHWQVDLGTSMVFTYGTSLAGLTYTVKSEDLDPTAQQLDKAPAPPAAIADEDMSVPAAYRALKPLAARITRHATTPYEKAVALQQWFTSTGGFSYNLNVTEPNTAAGLAKFLTVTKRGYCQQFAFAMAVLSRLLGIPARVAVGFTNGTATGTNTWVVKTSDAHAWPELYFQGAGWLRFEPTPSGVGGQGTASPPTYSIPATLGVPGNQTPATGSGSSGTGSTGTNNGNTSISQQIRRAGSNGGTGGKPAGHGGGFGAAPEILLLVVLALLLIAPWGGRSLLRRHRLTLASQSGDEAGADGTGMVPEAGGTQPFGPAGQGEITRGTVTRAAPESPADGPSRVAVSADSGGPRGPGRPGRFGWRSRAAQSAGTERTAGELARVNVARAHAAWREVLDDLTDYRIGRRPSESPRAIARRVSDELNLPAEAAGALGRLALAEERASYSGRPIPAGRLRPDVDAFQRGIAASVSRRVRWRARLLPASVIAPLQARLGRLAAALSPVNHAWWQRCFAWYYRRQARHAALTELDERARPTLDRVPG